MLVQIAAAFSAEILKLKRTLALTMVVVSPGVIILLSVLILLRRQEFAADANIWSMINGSALGLWAMMMLPLFIALETALTASIEHNGQNWKYLFAQPMYRSAIVIGKLLINIFLAALATMSMIVLNIIAGYLLIVLRPDAQLSTNVPLADIVNLYGIVFVVSLLIITIHTWISLRWSSIVVSIGSGIAAVVATIIVINSDYSRLFPWSLPGITALVARGTVTGGNITDPGAYVATSIVVALSLSVILAISCIWDISRRDVV